MPSSSVKPSPTPPPEAGALAVFESWATRNWMQGELNTESIAKYTTLWRTWLSWVAGQDLKWDKVTSADVTRFLHGPPPGKGGRRPAINPQRMSNHTQESYWRILLGVYAEAVRTEVMLDNPLLDVPQEERPSVNARDRQSQILEPEVFARLRQAKGIVNLIKTQSEQDWWHIRDRAMIAVLVETGITTAELIALRGMDVRGADSQTLPRSGQESLLPTSDTGVLIDVMETEEAVGRTLTMSPAMSELVHHWLSFRSRLLLERSAKSTSLAQRSAFMMQHATQGPLFVARRARESVEVLPSLDQVTVYYTVSQAIKALRKELYGDASVPRVAKGPAVIRNSRIRVWLDEIGVPATLEKTGLKSERSLRLKPQEGTQGS